MKSLTPLVFLAAAACTLSGGFVTAQDYPSIYWVFVDQTALDTQPIAFSERCLERRARTGLTIDTLDYPISAAALADIAGTGVTVRHASRWLRAVSVFADESLTSRLTNLPFVQSVARVGTFTAEPARLTEARLDEPLALTPEQEEYGYSLFQHEFINSVAVREAGVDGTGVLIAMFDTGFDTEHPAFDSARARIVAAYDFVQQDADVTGLDCPYGSSSYYQNRHGTLIFGVIGGNVPGTLLGIATGADYALAKTEITCEGTEIRLEEDNWIAAAEWADSLGADIITSSLGYFEWQDDDNYEYPDLNGDTAYITRAADVAASRNIVVVNSAGNNRANASWPYIGFPADGDSVIAVGAATSDSSVAGFSSPGPTYDGRVKPDVAALGVSVYTASAEPNRGYGAASGTSLAAPLVAGAAALMLDANPDLTAEDIRSRLRRSGDRADDPDDDFGYGLIDVRKAADFIRFEEIPIIQVRVDADPETTLVTTAGSEGGETPTLTLLTPSEGIEFEDLQDGTGYLIAEADQNSPLHRQVQLEARVTVISDTALVAVETIGQNPGRVFAGPNPFSDSLTIFVSADLGAVNSVSIFNLAGERVWQMDNVSNVTADGNREWQMVRWNSRNSRGQEVASGVYLVYVSTARSDATIKVVKRH